MVMVTLLIATSNTGKVAEISHELATAGLGDLAVKCLRDFPAMAPILEDQPGFVGNAMKKAFGYASAAGLPAIADDSGLCVDALNGAPGVLSARYAGEPCDDAANNRRLVRELQALPHAGRRAQFVCAAALALPRANLAVMVDSVEGIIIDEPRGSNGFGYDPHFYIPELGCTTAELTLAEKAVISHRGKAVRKLMAWLKENRVAFESLANGKSVNMS